MFLSIIFQIKSLFDIEGRMSSSTQYKNSLKIQN